ncbi:von Willebrand factor type A domain-containing protein [Mycena metata]|uniref:von Willebrand factor type A domain-containing protein n=1 Tax=Mycena metata TaxID=1033252 RepID=A0AAD7NX39_9AGAR|nr:von Willebrand factor type A domain-containing protein [Mycena metata]
MSRNPWGLYYLSENRTISLPLLHVHAAASIKELAAEVKLTQTYLNDTGSAREVGYSFPVPARAVVCSFVMIKQDGMRVVGLVQEKGEARETYNAAVSQGKQAALMEQQTPDVFQVAVGNIQPHETVKIELLYATVLAEDEENDSIRFHLPMHIGARYGQAPSSGPALPSNTSDTFMEISANVESVAPIAKIGCPSHTVSTELGPDPALPNAHELPFSYYARVSLSSAAALDKDFILTVKSVGLDPPRCVAERHPTNPTTALAFTLVPRFKLPDIARQEFIFLVDRSGSMKASRILAAKRALIVMLRSLPAKDSVFQIASFGRNCTMLWDEGSRPYNQAMLDKATQHVDSMQANYGGTRIREALVRCFAARKTDRPTSVFVLTDGAAWDVDGVLKEVKVSVSAGTAQAHLRVSVLGIGNSASTAMCEGIARVGNGTCMMVGEQETIFTGKIARMLKAARTPMITGIVVDWGVPTVVDHEPPAEEIDDDEFVIVSEVDAKGKGKAPLNVFDESVDPLQTEDQSVPPPPEVVLSPPPPVQQSPFKIQSLSPGIRLNVYAILQGTTVPKVVTLTGFTEDGSKIELSVPVNLSNLPNTPDSPPAIHALAARKIIQDIEDGQHAITPSIPEDADLLARTIKAHIVRLAKLHSIMSSHTSFVAVDESSNSPSAALSHAQPIPATESRAAQIELKRVKLSEMRQSRSRPRIAHTSGSSAAVVVLDESLGSGDGVPTGPLPATHSELPTLTPAQFIRQSWQQQRRDAGSAEITATDDATVPLVWDRGSPFNFSMGAQAPVGQDQADLALLTTRLTEAVTQSTGRRRSNSSPSLSAGRPPVNAAVPRVRDRSGPLNLSMGAQEFVGRDSAAPAPLSTELSIEAQATSSSFTPRAVEHTPNPAPPVDVLETLARHQSFDGCFTQGVLSTIQLNDPPDEVRATLGVSDEVFATIIAMAFLCTRLGPNVEPESWEAIYDKARAFVEDALREVSGTLGADELQARAFISVKPENCFKKERTGPLRTGPLPRIRELDLCGHQALTMAKAVKLASKVLAYTSVAGAVGFGSFLFLTRKSRFVPFTFTTDPGTYLEPSRGPPLCRRCPEQSTRLS